MSRGLQEVDKAKEALEGVQEIKVSMVTDDDQRELALVRRQIDEMQTVRQGCNERMLAAIEKAINAMPDGPEKQAKLKALQECRTMAAEVDKMESSMQKTLKYKRLQEMQAAIDVRNNKGVFEASKDVASSQSQILDMWKTIRSTVDDTLMQREAEVGELDKQVQAMPEGDDKATQEQALEAMKASRDKWQLQHDELTQLEQKFVAKSEVVAAKVMTVHVYAVHVYAMLRARAVAERFVTPRLMVLTRSWQGTQGVADDDDVSVEVTATVKQGSGKKKKTDGDDSASGFCSCDMPCFIS